MNQLHYLNVWFWLQKYFSQIYAILGVTAIKLRLMLEKREEGSRESEEGNMHYKEKRSRHCLLLSTIICNLVSC